MGRTDGKSNTVWIVLGVLVALGVVCCGGAAVMGFLGVREIKEHPEEFREKVQGLVTEMAGAAHPAAENFCTVFLAENRVDDAWALTSAQFQTTTGRSGFDDLHDAVHNVMGDFVSMSLRNFNRESKIGTGSGTFAHLKYDAAFAKGGASIDITLRDVGGTHLVEQIRVTSPLFMKSYAGHPSPGAEDGSAPGGSNETPPDAVETPDDR